ncbi:MAG TPA: DUF222 domain-containing protein [Candidatus Acidoferrum sp.]|nr:DUF222 domain-containing protein [Candidatus Acidoferrum sp.]
MCRSSENPFDRINAALDDVPGWLAKQASSAMGQVAIDCQQVINRMQGVSVEATRRFEESGAYRADGALGVVPWLKDKARLSGGEAAEHVQVARQLKQLSRTEEALARGEINYQHAVTMARAAEQVGAAAVRKSETTLLKAAQTMDAGAFATVAKNFQHEVDHDGALAEANRAHQRRYLSIGEPLNGLARIEGQLVPEAVASLRTAIEPYMKPIKGDERTYGQRTHDALVEALSRRSLGHPNGTTHANGARSGNGSSPRPLLIIKTSIDTLAGIAGAPAGQLEWGGTIPAETVRRLGCDSAITRITGLGELEYEITHAARTIPPATRRALVARDGHCVFPGCDRPAPWCQGHHLVFWGDGGPTKLENLGLVCSAHHRRVHEEGWQLQRNDGRWMATPPLQRITPRSRSN